MKEKESEPSFEFSGNMNGIKWGFSPSSLHPDAG
jgi:hypothetical protein